MTTYLESPNGLLFPPSRNGHDLTESLHEYAATVTLLETRISQLELQLEEQGWLRLDQEGGREFGRTALDRITDLARVNYLKNPLINRAVEVGALYVWGQDLSVNAADETVKAVVDRFWHDNRRTLTGQQASRLIEVELQVTGNVFLALFPDRITGGVRVRTVPMEEIREIVTNPEDRYEPWYYKRAWSETPIGGSASRQMTAYYPDWQYQPAARDDRIGGVEVRWDAPLLHVKSGAFPHWRWGVSEVYAALDWARAYKEQLEDDATRSRALARFAWQLTTQGGRQGVAAAKTKLGTTLGSGGGSGTETNPPPVAGSTFIAGQGVNLDPIRIAGATLDPDHSRPARLMAAAALGLPDTFFGDVDQGTLATAKSLDRPTELKYSERRQVWRDVLADLLQWVIDRDIEAARGILAGRQLTEEQRQVDLSWPDLLERDIVQRVTAVVDAATLAGRTLAGTVPEDTVARLLMVALGVENIDDELATLADERAERAERAQQIAQQMRPTNDDDEGDDNEDDLSREAFVAALRDVREALRQ